MSHKRYPIRIPCHAAGIRAQEPRSGGAGRSWWARRWAEVLEGMNLRGRLGRGKNYALSGQVVSLEAEGGTLHAQVVGTRPEPYDVTFSFRQPDEATHARLVAALKAEPMLIARLLADDLPLEVAEIFRANGAHLFPGGKLGPGKYDMTTHCTCPDYANPCKHAAAVLILLGEEIARRPLTLLALRGISAAELCDLPESP